MFCLLHSLVFSGCGSTHRYCNKICPMPTFSFSVIQSGLMKYYDFFVVQNWAQPGDIFSVKQYPCGYSTKRMSHWFRSNIFMGKEKLHKQHSGRLIESLKMERVRTILTHRYPYPHEHSRHFIIAVFVCWLFFISSDNMQTLIMKLDKNFKWWSMYACLIGFFYFFSSPFIRKTIKPNYSNFSRW